MNQSQKLELEQFWKVVKTVFSEENPFKISDLEVKTGLKAHHLNSFIAYLKDVGVGIELYDKEGESWLSVPHKPKINFELDLVEWLEVQSILPWISSIADEGKRHSMEQLFARLEKDQEEHDHFEAFQSLETKFHYLKSGHSIVLRILEEQILKESCVKIKLLENEQVELKPYKTVEISSELMVIGEDLTHKCLACFSVAEISSVEVLDKNPLPTYTDKEIKQFINQLSSIDGEVIRLILKFKNIHAEDFGQAPFDTFGRPFIISHKDSAFIWAATLEPTDHVYSWLYQFGNNVDILGPDSFLKDYIKYCETELKKIA